MKIYVKASATDLQDIRKKIADTLYEYIRYELWRQDEHDYYKQIRKQFTVNGRKYVVKNDANHRLHILNPERVDLYGYSIPDSLNGNRTDDMALAILNDAYGDAIDLDMKKMNISHRVNREYFAGGVDYAGKYIQELKDRTRNGTSGRYAVVNMERDYSYSDREITWFDDENEAISFAKDFIKTMSNKEFKDCTSYMTSVIDSQIGEEIYHEGYKDYANGQVTSI